jgi:hypothetical protein
MQIKRELQDHGATARRRPCGHGFSLITPSRVRAQHFSIFIASTTASPPAGLGTRASLTQWKPRGPALGSAPPCRNRHLFAGITVPLLLRARYKRRLGSRPMMREVESIEHRPHLHGYRLSVDAVRPHRIAGLPS